MPANVLGLAGYDNGDGTVGFGARVIRCDRPRLGQQIEQIPLRHQREIRKWFQAAKVNQRLRVAADNAIEMVDTPLRQLCEFLQKTEFIENLQGRGMHGVAAEIAQEIGVLLKYRHHDPGARQQQAQHHPGRTAADDAAAGMYGCSSDGAHRTSMAHAAAMAATSRSCAQRSGVCSAC